jgi:hypothetical protein
VIGFQKRFPGRDLWFHLIIYLFNLYHDLLLFGTGWLILLSGWFRCNGQLTLACSEYL